MVRRHLYLILALSVLYLIVNLTFTKVTGTPVYKPMDWESTEGILTPIGVLVGAILIFFLVDLLNQQKLKANGYHHIVKVALNKKNPRSNKKVMDELSNSANNN